MAIKQGREYRALQDFSLVPRDEGSKEYRVRGTAIVFNSPTVLWECDGVEYKEIIDRHAFDECDMSDVIFNYNHGGKVVARLRNKTLALNIDERGVNIEADLGGTTAGRELYEEIDGGYVDKMSFSFTVREAKYDSVTHTRTITKVKKLYDVSAVDIPAYNDTSISARSFFAARLFSMELFRGGALERACGFGASPEAEETRSFDILTTHTTTIIFGGKL
jgi:HK97 family phage prohead protease